MTATQWHPTVCDECGARSKVVQTITQDTLGPDVPAAVIRRRKCPHCGQMWTTQERASGEVIVSGDVSERD